MAEKRTADGWKKKNDYIQKYMKGNYDNVSLRLKKGEREKYNAFAEWLGISRAEMIQCAVEKYMQDKGFNG